MIAAAVMQLLSGALVVAISRIASLRRAQGLERSRSRAVLSSF
jgi:hypothetical protein